MAVLSTTTESVHTRSARRAAQSAFLGSTLEYYDFFIYGAAAALVFGPVFFPADHPTTSALLSIATLGAAYVARPVGAVLWGHLGDRIGRRSALLGCLLLMGVATFLIGCLPTYEQVGVAAPILLVSLRLLQGLSAGGEAPGSSSLTLEHAPDGFRGFYSSFTISGIMFGIVLSGVVFIPVASLPDEQLYSWGWRIPFLLSIAVTFVAYLLRRTLDETSVFKELKTEDATAEVPLVTLLRDHWRKVVVVSLMALFPMVTTVVSVYGLAHGVASGFPRTTVLWAVIAGTTLAVVLQPAFALLSDRLGRKPVFIVGTVGGGLLGFQYFDALEAGSTSALFIWTILMLGTFYAAASGVYPAFFAEQFPAHVRYSGLAVSVMLGLLAAGFTPALIQGTAGGSASVAATWVLAFQLIAAAAACFSRETSSVPTSQLGR